MTRSTLPARRSQALSTEDVAVLRSMLEEQREFRMDQLRQLHHPGPGALLSTTDPEIYRSLSAGARAALCDVQAALWRMDEGSYGRCTECDGPVELERLEILPQAATCLACRPAAPRG
jgi:RNA polymerase-binding transcription factor